MVVVQGEVEVRWQRNHTVRVSCMGSYDRCFWPFRSGSKADDYREFATRWSSSVFGFGLQEIWRATVDGFTTGPLEDELEPGGNSRGVGHSLWPVGCFQRCKSFQSMLNFSPDHFAHGGGLELRRCWEKLPQSLSDDCADCLS